MYIVLSIIFISFIWYKFISIFRTGIFSADEKMINSYKLLSESTTPSYNKLIYHSDIDEIPDKDTLNQALLELQSGNS
jgi:hypothetical protein